MSELVERAQRLCGLDFIKATAIVKLSGMAKNQAAIINLVNALNPNSKSRAKLNIQEAGRILDALEKAYNLLGEGLGVDSFDSPWNCKCHVCGTKFLESRTEKSDTGLICINSPDCPGEGDDIEVYK
ncbi:MAG TPA: hypothetical protein DDW81_02740 [Cryomorphaceae bacterium]|nr:hypothetical protein [Owenweeksia sp.]HBF18984.1 hypothetical protein [Cryomorphaceae bacterium]|tara:strand:+ start:866 stop:1246 length:381 start_codon:yes stop_codon:yes gene_type:complete